MPLDTIAAHRQELHKLIPLSTKQADNSVWLHGVLETDNIDNAAECVACLMIDYCCVNQRLKESWQAKRQGGAYASPSVAKQLDGFLGPIFGTKSKTVPQTHTQGAIAEFLWYLLFDEQDDVTNKRVRLEGPDFRPTSSGGDGLGIYEDGEGAYFFKLWEIKKHTAASSPKSKIDKAATQLDTRAVSYLAQYAQVLSRPERNIALAKFYSELPKYWIEQSSEAGLGISVISSKNFPEDSFAALEDKFGWVANSNMRTGVSIYVNRFTDLVTRVQQKVLEGME